MCVTIMKKVDPGNNNGWHKLRYVKSAVTITKMIDKEREIDQLYLQRIYQVSLTTDPPLGPLT